VNFVWRKGISQDSHDRLDPDELTTERSDFIRCTLPRLARIRAGQCFIEKSVSNTLRVRFVSSVFPEARFVHLIRDGRDVTESAMRQWNAAPEWRTLITKLSDLRSLNPGYALWFVRNTTAGSVLGRKGGKVWGPRYPGIDSDTQTRTLVELCALQWQHSVTYARADLALLPQDRVYEIRYEDLVNNPEAIARLVAALELPDREVILSAHQMRVETGSGGRWRSMSDGDRKQMDDIIGPTLQDLGYATP
jgi:hypothetical protein